MEREYLIGIIDPAAAEEYHCEVALVETAVHEEGHAIVASDLAGAVSKRTIIPEGNALGLTVADFSNFPLAEGVRRMMATACGGWVAEELVGKTDHRGTGSDMATLDYLANYASRFIYQGKLSAGDLKSEAFSLARSILNTNRLLYRASRLYRERVIVY